MYHYSRAIFRALKDMVEPQTDSVTPGEARRQVLEACERTVQRLAEDPRYFARPARSLFEEIRFYFPITQQARVYFVIDRAIGVPGAQTPDVLLSALEQAWSKAHPLSTVSGTDDGRDSSDSGEACSDGSCAI